MKLQIKVTKEILEKSMWCGTEKAEDKSVSTNCAVAMALRDVFGFCQVSNKITFWDCGRIDVPLTLETINFITSFDRLWSEPKERLKLPEYTFEIDLPEQIVNSINIDDIYNSKTLELIK